MSLQPVDYRLLRLLRSAQGHFGRSDPGLALGDLVVDRRPLEAHKSKKSRLGAYASRHTVSSTAVMKIR